MMQTQSNNQLIDFPMNETIAQDFDAYVSHLFDTLKKQFGFQSPMLFMHDEEQKFLKLVSSETPLQFSLDHPGSLLVKAYHSYEIQTSHSSQEIFEGVKPEEEHEGTLFFALPIIVFEEPIGVLLLASTEQKELSDLERVFLQNFTSQIGVHLFTAWALKQASSESATLKKENEQYKELIRVKKSFLMDLQELLLRQAREKKGEEKEAETLNALSYLNSLLMLSDNTVGASHTVEHE